MSQVSTIFGKEGGCFSLTSKNIKAVTKNVVDFKATKKWTWSIQDVLGITIKGKKTERHSKLMEVLKGRDDAESVALYNELLDFNVDVEEAEMIRTHRLTTSQKAEKFQAKKAELIAKLGESVENFSDEEIDAMARRA